MQSSENVSTRLQRIAKLAADAPDMVFTSLNHHLDMDLLREAYRRTSKKAAPGIDGVVAQEYEKELDANLSDLLNRAKSGRYRAPAVKRAYIPKGKGETRPIGIPTLEDKVLQRAVVMILDEVYEPLFRKVSYGFRRGKSQRGALRAIWKGLTPTWGGWVIELDIRKYFDTIPHRYLREILCQRVRDGVLIRLVGKWLNAGVMEGGIVHYPESGTPQGGVISPLLANIYLNEVLDKWFEDVVTPCLAGKGFLVRFADDAVMGFTEEKDARRVMKVLHKRFGKFGLELHPEKTRLVNFRCPDHDKDPPEGGSATFPFLGFTHYWGKTRKGRWVVKVRTAGDRFTKAISRIYSWCKSVRHWRLSEQYRALRRKMLGHYAYYGVTGNSLALSRFKQAVTKVWFKWVRRRAQRRTLTWEEFNLKLLWMPLPVPRIVHSFQHA